MIEEAPNEIQRRAHETWEAFCDDLKQAGAQLIRSDLALDELEAAEGLRYLSRMVRTGLERHVEGADPAAPYLHALCDERIKGFGGDNPDTRYFGATLSSDYEYRLSGDFRTCAYVSLMTTGFDGDGAYRVTGSLDSDDIPDALVSPVDIVVTGRAGDAVDGASRDSPLELPMTADTKSLLVRCTFEDTSAKEGLRLGLVRTDASEVFEPCVYEKISTGLLEVPKFVRTTVETWTHQSVALRSNFNQLPLQDPERMRKAGGDPNVFYYSAAWSVAEDEFLVIRLSKIPECTTWGLQINSLWTESLDYTQARIHLNKSTAHLDPGGGATIVVSERDPGHPNWLRTMGHRSGTANLRMMGAKEPVVADVQIVRSPPVLETVSE